MYLLAAQISIFHVKIAIDMFGTMDSKNNFVFATLAIYAVTGKSHECSSKYH